ncbi:alanine dehydrogenase [Marivirga tractuosa]|uniref:alanine dehydrogenase n=1 Tax=Marivirga tractuosa (strain ATCC 23168 / DSM 4126 / NBRC 15989 / NCIMB 1408 / VKM B-1430 / H-43) TaxID=643867 RepID=E4TNC0_MARTH|nr:alanine dehydrogenase [Marivirga tractuosa]ADR23508.1 alanine dehydrogenase/PNT domain protein [Marivirga tractuosa DSM 4126]BDD15813.1 alanine dehydrogenase [Marivirga tractuosa]
MAKEISRKGFDVLARKGALYPQEELLAVERGKNAMQIGIPNEISLQEKRVPLTPGAVALLSNNGHEVIVESGMGLSSNFTDNEYSDAGAKIVYSSKEAFEAQLVVKIEPPVKKEIEMFKPGSFLISALQVGQLNKEYFQLINEKRITAIGIELIEDKVGGMPMVRAMSEIAGISAIQIATELLSNLNNGKGIILGGITGVRPTKVVILGAGTVGEYAARAALGLGANIEIYDNHLYKLRRIKHAIGQPIHTSSMDTVMLSDSLTEADVLICAVRAEKGRSGCIVTEEMVMNMRKNAVIIDVSIDQGGCVETSEVTSHDNPTFKKYDVIHYCVPNIASRVSRTASNAVSNILTPMLLQAGDVGGIEEMIFTHSWFMKGVYTYKGSLTNMHIAKKFDLKYKELSLLMAARF